jgi:hypothetical protein
VAKIPYQPIKEPGEEGNDVPIIHYKWAPFEVRLGDEGRFIYDMQHALRFVESVDARVTFSEFEAHGRYDKKTANAIGAFQRVFEIKEDTPRRVTPRTLFCLSEIVKENGGLFQIDLYDGFETQ